MASVGNMDIDISTFIKNSSDYESDISWNNLNKYRILYKRLSQLREDIHSEEEKFGELTFKRSQVEELTETYKDLDPHMKDGLVEMNACCRMIHKNLGKLYIESDEVEAELHPLVNSLLEHGSIHVIREPDVIQLIELVKKKKSVFTGQILVAPTLEGMDVVKKLKKENLKFDIVK